MPRHISWPSIEQFRHVIQQVKQNSSFLGLDEQGEPIYDHTKILPTLKFQGTVKLHGTNAGICYNDSEGIWAQSREQILAIGSDNAGFAAWVSMHEETLVDLLKAAALTYEIGTSEHTICLFGEWAGQGIQSGVAITQIPKSFFVFGLCSFKETEGEEGPIIEKTWFDHRFVRDPAIRVFNILDYPNYEIEIDFNSPERAQNQLIDLTNQVESECPVAKALGVSGVGEGIVWTCAYNGNHYRFKVKGEKHSISKVKTIAAVDTEKLDSIASFVEYAVTDARFEQGIQAVFGSRENLDDKKIGDLMRWIIGDIAKEESDVMEENELTPKDVNKNISDAIRKRYFSIVK